MVDVYLNGRLVGKTDSPEEITEKVRNLRRKGLLTSELNISFLPQEDEIRINADGGRIQRPLIILDKDGKPQLNEKDIERIKKGELKWSDLICLGKVEYLDTDEEENTFIAVDNSVITTEHSHLEIDPIAIVGIPASNVPYSNYSRGDRVNYGASKGVKQALGLYALNYLLRMDTYSNILHYPQSPIVRTKTTSVVGFDRHPAGQNFVVAILAYDGYNMEDALVINKGSLDRGLARSTFYRPYTAVEKRYPGGQEDEICIPDKGVRGYRVERVYRNLGEDGIAEVESGVGSDDVLIGRTSPPRFLGSMSSLRMGVENRRETSVVVRHGEGGFVDLVAVTEDSEGNTLVKVRVRDERIPEIGDKFSSRHGQKGVVGMIVPEEDMPFIESGVVPDLITNPHGIPSRMTVSQLMEIMSGKSGTLSGEFIDGSAFTEDPMKGVAATLKRYGLKPNGKEVMVNGMTGEQYEVEIFQGLIYYHKLRHMVSNKIHARSRGPVQILTRQPTEGRAKKGGLRMGEMEKDCLIAHGAALLLKERFDSDSTVIPVCGGCGLVAVHDHIRDKLYCPMCGEASTVYSVEMSYAFHILLSELLSIGIYPRLVLEDKG